MLYTSAALEALIHHLSKLPTIGRKTAQRIALQLLKEERSEVNALAQAILDLKEKIHYCSTCWNITETDPCPICASARRDKNTICVVEEPNDVLAIERTNEFHGQYHVLGGSLSPLDGIGPEELRIRELLTRLTDGVIEVILALNPNVDGEATTVYLARLMKPLGIKVTRIARGLPIGSDLEFADEATLSRALEGRSEV